MTRLGSELLRKAVHVGIGGCAFLLRWLAPWQAALVAALALLFNLLVLHRITRRALLREGERARGFSWGIALYPAVVLGVILVFRSRLELAAAVWALLAFGDGMAAVCGLLVRGPRLPWNPGKTWAGFAAFVLYGTAAAAILIRWTQQAVLDAARGATSADVAVGASFLAASPGAGALSDLAFLLLGCFAAAVAAGFAESLDSGVDDNVLVPLVGGAVLGCATLVEPGLLSAVAGDLGGNFVWGAAVNAVLALAALAVGGVGLSGAISGWVLGTLLFGFGGWPAFLMLFLFFALGTLTTKLGFAKKAALGIAQSRGGRRGARNALANTAAGVFFAFLAVATPYAAACSVAMVAAFATAACDTVSSEIGQAFGRHHFLVTTFRRVRAGTDGAVSWEGTLAGIGAALVLALTAWTAGLVSVGGVAIVTVAAFFGATLESYLGATVERLAGIDNEFVNFTNTVVGAVAALLLHNTLG